jgi:hypothetical protein
MLGSRPHRGSSRLPVVGSLTNSANGQNADREHDTGGEAEWDRDGAATGEVGWRWARLRDRQLPAQPGQLSTLDRHAVGQAGEEIEARGRDQPALGRHQGRIRLLGRQRERAVANDEPDGDDRHELPAY